MARQLCTLEAYALPSSDGTAISGLSHPDLVPVALARALFHVAGPLGTCLGDSWWPLCTVEPKQAGGVCGQPRVCMCFCTCTCHACACVCVHVNHDDCTASQRPAHQEAAELIFRKSYLCSQPPSPPPSASGLSRMDAMLRRTCQAPQTVQRVSLGASSLAFLCPVTLPVCWPLMVTGASLFSQVLL